jgi:Tol biopolymer transport system component
VSQTPANTAYPDRTPVWSADGRLIYHIAVVGLEDNQIFIAERVANRWTETKVPLRAAGAPPTVDSWPQWSNDGRRISFIRSRTDNNGDLMVTAADGTGLRKVGEDVAGFAVQCWSPDDRAIAVINAELDVMIGTESEPGYRVVSVDGTSPPVLIRTPGRRSFDSCSWQRVASQR